MRKDRFEYLCKQTESGNSSFVSHGSTNEEGRIQSCSMTHLIVDTNDGNRRCWDYTECDEISRSGSRS